MSDTADNQAQPENALEAWKQLSELFPEGIDAEVDKKMYQLFCAIHNYIDNGYKCSVGVY